MVLMRGNRTTCTLGDEKFKVTHLGPISGRG